MAIGAGAAVGALGSLASGVLPSLLFALGAPNNVGRAFGLAGALQGVISPQSNTQRQIQNINIQLNSGTLSPTEEADALSRRLKLEEQLEDENLFLSRVRGFGLALAGITSGLIGAARAAEQFNNSILQSQVNFAAETTLYTAANEKLVDPLERLNSIRAESAQFVKDLQRDTLLVPGATTESVLNIANAVFQNIGAIQGQLNKSDGSSFSNEFDAARQLSVAITSAFGQLGLGPYQATQEVRGLLQGEINPDSILASRRINKEDFNRAKAQGQLADYVLRELNFDVAANELKSKTLENVTSNVFQDFPQQASVNFGEGFRTFLLEPLISLQNTIFDSAIGFQTRIDSVESKLRASDDRLEVLKSQNKETTAEELVNRNIRSQRESLIIESGAQFEGFDRYQSLLTQRDSIESTIRLAQEGKITLTENQAAGLGIELERVTTSLKEFEEQTKSNYDVVVESLNEGGAGIGASIQAILIPTLKIFEDLYGIIKPGVDSIATLIKLLGYGLVGVVSKVISGFSLLTNFLVKNPLSSAIGSVFSGAADRGIAALDFISGGIQSQLFESAQRRFDGKAASNSQLLFQSELAKRKELLTFDVTQAGNVNNQEAFEQLSPSLQKQFIGKRDSFESLANNPLGQITGFVQPLTTPSYNARFSTVRDKGSNLTENDLQNTRVKNFFLNESVIQGSIDSISKNSDNTEAINTVRQLSQLRQVIEERIKNVPGAERYRLEKQRDSITSFLNQATVQFAKEGIDASDIITLQTTDKKASVNSQLFTEYGSRLSEVNRQAEVGSIKTFEFLQRFLEVSGTAVDNGLISIDQYLGDLDKLVRFRALDYDYLLKIRKEMERVIDLEAKRVQQVLDTEKSQLELRKANKEILESELVRETKRLESQGLYTKLVAEERKLRNLQTTSVINQEQLETTTRLITTKEQRVKEQQSLGDNRGALSTQEEVKNLREQKQKQESAQKASSNEVALQQVQVDKLKADFEKSLREAESSVKDIARKERRTSISIEEKRVGALVDTGVISQDSVGVLKSQLEQQKAVIALEEAKSSFDGKEPPIEAFGTQEYLEYQEAVLQAATATAKLRQELQKAQMATEELSISLAKSFGTITDEQAQILEKRRQLRTLDLQRFESQNQAETLRKEATSLIDTESRLSSQESSLKQDLEVSKQELQSSDSRVDAEKSRLQRNFELSTEGFEEKRKDLTTRLESTTKNTEVLGSKLSPELAEIPKTSKFIAGSIGSAVGIISDGLREFGQSDSAIKSVGNSVTEFSNSTEFGTALNTLSEPELEYLQGIIGKEGVSTSKKLNIFSNREKDSADIKNDVLQQIQNSDIKTLVENQLTAISDSTTPELFRSKVDELRRTVSSVAAISEASKANEELTTSEKNLSEQKEAKEYRDYATSLSEQRRLSKELKDLENNKTQAEERLKKGKEDIELSEKKRREELETSTSNKTNRLNEVSSRRIQVSERLESIKQEEIQRRTSEFNRELTIRRLRLEIDKAEFQQELERSQIDKEFQRYFNGVLKTSSDVEFSQFITKIQGQITNLGLSRLGLSDAQTRLRISEENLSKIDPQQDATRFREASEKVKALREEVLLSQKTVETEEKRVTIAIFSILEERTKKILGNLESIRKSQNTISSLKLKELEVSVNNIELAGGDKAVSDLFQSEATVKIKAEGLKDIENDINSIRQELKALEDPTTARETIIKEISSRKLEASSIVDKSISEQEKRVNVSRSELTTLQRSGASDEEIKRATTELQSLEAQLTSLKTEKVSIEREFDNKINTIQNDATIPADLLAEQQERLSKALESNLSRISDYQRSVLNLQQDYSTLISKVIEVDTKTRILPLEQRASLLRSAEESLKSQIDYYRQINELQQQEIQTRLITNAAQQQQSADAIGLLNTFAPQKDRSAAQKELARQQFQRDFGGGGGNLIQGENLRKAAASKRASEARKQLELEGEALALKQEGELLALDGEEESLKLAKARQDVEFAIQEITLKGQKSALQLELARLAVMEQQQLTAAETAKAQIRAGVASKVISPSEGAAAIAQQDAGIVATKQANALAREIIQNQIGQIDIGLGELGRSKDLSDQQFQRQSELFGKKRQGLLGRQEAERNQFNINARSRFRDIERQAVEDGLSPTEAIGGGARPRNLVRTPIPRDINAEGVSSSSNNIGKSEVPPVAIDAQNNFVTGLQTATEALSRFTSALNNGGAKPPETPREGRVPSEVPKGLQLPTDNPNLVPKGGDVSIPKSILDPTRKIGERAYDPTLPGNPEILFPDTDKEIRPQIVMVDGKDPKTGKDIKYPYTVYGGTQNKDFSLIRGYDPSSVIPTPSRQVSETSMEVLRRRGESKTLEEQLGGKLKAGSSTISPTNINNVSTSIDLNVTVPPSNSSGDRLRKQYRGR